MDKNILDYCEDISFILRNIEDRLDTLNENNFDKLLDDFGYKFFCIENANPNWEKLKKTNNLSGVYVFKEILEEETGCINKEQWELYKDFMGSNAVPKWNGNDRKEIFYVGKSNVIGKRVKEHMTTASCSTSALKLKFFQDKYCSELQYKVYVFYLEDKNSKKNAISELIESILHSKLLPTVGSKKLSK